MSSEEILNELLKNSRQMQNSMKIMQGDIQELKDNVVDLNDKFSKLDEKVNNLEKKVSRIDEIEEKVNRIDRTVIKIELDYTKKIDLIYENTVSFLEANYKNRDAIEKLDKRVERLECMMPTNPKKLKEAIS